MHRKINKILISLFLFSFLNAANVPVANAQEYSLAEILLKAKETKNINEKKRLLKKSFNIRPTLYAIKMLIKINKDNSEKCLKIIEFANGIFPLNKYLALMGAQYSLKTGKTNKAEYFIFNYLKTYPFDKDLLYKLAEYYIKTGKTESAQRAYKTIYKLYGDKKAFSLMKNISSVFN